MKILLLLIIPFLFFSCKPNFALFQPGSTENHRAYEIKRETFEVDKLTKKEAGFHINKPFNAKIGFKKILFRPIVPKHSHIKSRGIVKIEPEQTVFEKIKQKEKPKKKKKGNQLRKIGSNVFIGLIFLGLAIILALIHIDSLAILFAVVSIIFLIIGLKKIFRRQRVKNIFKR